ncbi:MAG TPA: ComF family protein [Candidatus Methylomirabilis sp.]|nr:ComF family protein [Candidatus Methylomirabilis sp.]
MAGEHPSRPVAAALGRGARAWLAEASDAVISLFFPAGCRICDALLTRAGRVPICEDCLASFEAPPERSCEICGQPQPAFVTEPGELVLCRACQVKTYAFERARTYGTYEGALARAILILKWERMEPLAAWFAARLAEVVSRQGDKLAAADVVVPVPLHKNRQRQRGYNQAALISKSLARRLHLPHQELLLVRTRPRPDKQILSLDERWASVRGAFATRPGSQVDNRRVLLVDDVMTTGATLDACARALLDGGARAVVGLTIARAAHNPFPVPETGQRKQRDERKPA